jgi:hypothetical protein
MAVLAVIGVVVAVRQAAPDRHRPATPVTVTRAVRCLNRQSLAQFEIIDRATLKVTGRIPFAANPRAGA